MHTSGSGTLHTKTASNGYFKAGKKIWEWEREESVLSFFSSSYIPIWIFPTQIQIIGTIGVVVINKK